MFHKQHILLQKPKKSQPRRTTAFAQQLPLSLFQNWDVYRAKRSEKKKNALKTLDPLAIDLLFRPHAVTTSHVDITRWERCHSPKSKSSPACFSSGLFSRDPQHWNQNASHNAYTVNGSPSRQPELISPEKNQPDRWSRDIQKLCCGPKNKSGYIIEYSSKYKSKSMQKIK